VRDAARNSFADGAERPAAASSAAARYAVRRLALTEFRCYAQLRLEVEAHFVVLTGPNGAGKTNLLEALSFLAPGRGLRRARLDAVGRINGTAHWVVAATLATPEGRLEIGTGRDPDAGEGSLRRVVRIDGKSARGQQALTQQLSVLWVTPDMERLFQEGSSARRRFLDRMVYGVDPEHAGRVAAYDHALRERARLLREGIGDPAWLAALEGIMAEKGVAVAAARRALVRRLGAALRDARGPFPRAALTLEGAVDGWLDDGPALEAEDRFRAELARAREADATFGGAAWGPHRSDLAVRHLDTNMSAALASTGEQKALLLSLILAHGRLQALDRGAAPLLLLDEVGAHLDRVRRAALWEALAELGGQTWMTGTDEALFEPLGTNAQHFRVVDANVVPR
jgi:DNA replication and repair protein RecF